MRHLVLLLVLASSPAVAGPGSTATVTRTTPINAVTAGANYTQPMPTDASNAWLASYHCKWSSLTGVLDGHFDVEVSNDKGVTWAPKVEYPPYPQPTPDPTHVVTMDVVGTDGSNAVTVNHVSELLYRVKWVKEGVTGGLVTCFAAFKG